MSVAPKLCSLIFVVDEAQRKVLLGLKKRGFGLGKFNGFGGKMEPNETMRACSARELAEESGIEVSPELLQRRGVLDFNMLSGGMTLANGKIASRIEVHIYSCKLSETRGDLCETDEMKPTWFDIDAVPLEKMWADDEYWLRKCSCRGSKRMDLLRLVVRDLPALACSNVSTVRAPARKAHVLGGKDVVASFVFQDHATVLSQQVEVLPIGAMQQDEHCTRRLRVDHLVYGVPGALEEACEAFYQKTGVRPSRGGTHKGLGTHNAIVALGGPDDGSNGRSFGYLEILALDPGQQPNPERVWMAMESVVASGQPRLVTWAADRAGDSDDGSALATAVARAKEEHGYDAGPVQAFSRATPDGKQLDWQLAYRHCA